jgi:hypothetical protein
VRQGIQDIYRNLAVDDVRNDLIVGDVVRSLSERRTPIVLTERRDHLERLAVRLRAVTPHVVVLQGDGHEGIARL